MSEDYQVVLFEKTMKHAALKGQAEAPLTGAQQAVTLKVRRDRTLKY